MPGERVAIDKHKRTMQDPAEFMDLDEHTTWLLESLLDECDYPMDVTVTVEVEEQ